jgi:hypothetical protein
MSMPSEKVILHIGELSLKKMYRSLVSRVKYDDGQSKYRLGTIVVLNVNPNVVGIGVE